MASQNVLRYHISWTPVSDESWRINFVGHVVDGCENAGAGFILRDQNAKFKAACAAPVINCSSRLGAELVGLKHGLDMALKLGVDYLEVETDNSIAMKVIFGVSIPSSSSSKQFIEDCSYLLKQFRCVKFGQVDIHSNQGANEVAAIGIGLKKPIEWLDEPPTYISETLTMDVIGRWIYKSMP
ncbi:hypothetical protein Ddye_018723 [Dipteronia dyeriana]|uniref:RNase H type-1 domain-containing protein n=1 Tax=Dipteronia dyeriana TaxID=168575 RepID=A0AAD9UBN4_9ROSI|nr:hypothetical protein Ddye_018723 [Dipteronia dyeriana]